VRVMSDRCRGAVLVLSTSVAGQRGPVASWVSTAGWAGAMRRTLGNAWVVTPQGVLDVEAVRAKGATEQLSSTNAPKWRRRLPVPVKTAVKDAREWQRARSFHVAPDGPWRDCRVEFVWQRHELFQTAGYELARALRVPAVSFVPAPLVWQADQWHVRRPGWNRLVETHGEARVLAQADVVAAGSEIVAEQLVRLGVNERRIVVARTGFDPEIFSGETNRRAPRERLALGDEFVVGWVGSFRGFHQLDLLVDAVSALGNRSESRPVLLLVGDGPERARIEEIAQERGVRVVMTGTVPQRDLHELISAMDVAVLLAGKDAQFHYSPLKLAEYLASGVAVVAPRTGAIPAQLTHGEDSLLVAAGDVAELANALAFLHDQPEERARLAKAARAIAEQRFSWDNTVAQIVAAVERHGAGQAGMGIIGRGSSAS